MTIIKRSDIVPVLFMGGTGGHFLSAFLYHAREGDNYWQFSKCGNAHHSQKNNSSFSGGVSYPAINHINALLKLPVFGKIMYIRSHCHDPSLALLHFDKVIKTYYETKDVDELNLVFLAKWGLDEGNLNIDELKNRLISPAMTAVHHSKYFEFPELGNYYESENLLNISWQELMHNDPITLINKLSQFTNLSVDRFPLDKLLTWRELTMAGVNECKTHLS